MSLRMPASSSSAASSMAPPAQGNAFDPYQEAFDVHAIGAGEQFNPGSEQGKQGGLWGALGAIKRRARGRNLSDKNLRIFHKLIGDQLRQRPSSAPNLSIADKSSIMAEAYDTHFKHGELSDVDMKDLKHIVDALSARMEQQGSAVSSGIQYQGANVSVGTAATPASARETMRMVGAGGIAGSQVRKTIQASIAPSAGMRGKKDDGIEDIFAPVEEQKKESNKYYNTRSSKVPASESKAATMTPEEEGVGARSYTEKGSLVTNEPGADNRRRVVPKGNTSRSIAFQEGEVNGPSTGGGEYSDEGESGMVSFDRPMALTPDGQLVFKKKEIGNELSEQQSSSKAQRWGTTGLMGGKKEPSSAFEVEDETGADAKGGGVIESDERVSKAYRGGSLQDDSSSIKTEHLKGLTGVMKDEYDPLHPPEESESQSGVASGALADAAEANSQTAQRARVSAAASGKTSMPLQVTAQTEQPYEKTSGAKSGAFASQQNVGKTNRSENIAENAVREKDAIKYTEPETRQFEYNEQGDQMPSMHTSKSRGGDLSKGKGSMGGTQTEVSEVQGKGKLKVEGTADGDGGGKAVDHLVVSDSSGKKANDLSAAGRGRDRQIKSGLEKGEQGFDSSAVGIESRKVSKTTDKTSQDEYDPLHPPEESESQSGVASGALADAAEANSQTAQRARVSAAAQATSEVSSPQVRAGEKQGEDEEKEARDMADDTQALAKKHAGGNKRSMKVMKQPVGAAKKDKGQSDEEPARAAFAWMIGGEAGFGIKGAGEVFARTLTRSGYFVCGYSEYPSLIRGGHNTYQANISEYQVSSNSELIDVLVALNKETVELHVAQIRADGIIIYDNAKIQGSEARGGRKDIKVIGIPFVQIAREAGSSELMRNTVAMGATAAYLQLDWEIFIQALSDSFGKKGGDILLRNKQVARSGYEYAMKEFRKNSIDLKSFPLRDKVSERAVMTGNDAVAIGALAGGCDFYSAYPMTPASSLLHTLAGLDREYGIVVKHVEDEISAINMAIGASFGGARAMTGTSGGGFSLMVEGVGLAAMTETPVVIYEAQRPGPATGLPTWTDQGDLRFVMHAAQGEFLRFIAAPGDLIECIEVTKRAFEVAEKYQIPAIVLSDKFLGESHFTCDAAEARAAASFVSDLRGSVVAQEGYQRYQDSSTGISPRTVPGTLHGEHLANSDEHDEYGISSEDALMRNKQMQKRMAKHSVLLEEIPAPKKYGPDDAQVTLIVWGSHKGPALDALPLLKNEGIHANVLHFIYLWPFPKEEIAALLYKTKKTVIIENNFTAQLAGLIKEQTGRPLDHKILKYDGRPLWPEEITRQVKETLKYQ